MRVKFLERCGEWAGGSAYDIDDWQADRLIAAGWCLPDDDGGPAPVIEPGPPKVISEPAD